MMRSDYWNALSSRQRAGLLIGAGTVVLIAVASIWWLLRDPYVVLAADLDVEQRQDLARRLDLGKLDYRVGASAIEVPRSSLADARVVAMGSEVDVPPNVGLELFKETDFSTTDFAQRINYQRALQGELTRTIQAIEGVRSARVHVILAEPGVFKRETARASAAVSLTMQAGKSLMTSQVRGIQRLVAASVPEIRIDDVVVLDERGAALTRPTSDVDGELSTAQLDLKRQAEQYLQGKVRNLVQEVAPHAVVSISVDAMLEERQLRVTTEEPVGVSGGAVARGGRAQRVAGVLVKERQLQRGSVSGFMPASADTGDTDDSVEQEYEYQVGRRTEQASSTPGAIRRLSVAVALQGAPAELSGDALEQLVANAVGIDRLRGDSLSVLLMPAAISQLPERVSDISTVTPAMPLSSAAPVARETPIKSIVLGFVVVILLLAMAASLRARSARRAETEQDVDIDAVTATVRTWLSEGTRDGRV